MQLCCLAMTYGNISIHQGLPGQVVREKYLESQVKVREFESNGYGSESSENLFILFKRGKDVHSQEIG